VFCIILKSDGQTKANLSGIPSAKATSMFLMPAFSKDLSKPETEPIASPSGLMCEEIKIELL
jgi:hypothetical protein